MEKVLLDTSFILSAVRNKIDIFEELLGYQIIIPKQVLIELNGIAKTKTEAKIALKIIEKNKFKMIDLKTKNTDKGIKKYARSDKNLIIATLDDEIKKSVRNRKIVIRGKRKIEIVWLIINYWENCDEYNLSYGDLEIEKLGFCLLNSWNQILNWE